MVLYLESSDATRVALFYLIRVLPSAMSCKTIGGLSVLLQSFFQNSFNLFTRLHQLTSEELQEHLHLFIQVFIQSGVQVSTSEGGEEGK